MVKNENDDIRRVIGDLNGGPAIVMPILELVTNDMNTTGSGRPRLAQSQRTAVSNAIKVYTTAGYSSNDFKWAHVGFLDEKATLFDTRPTLTPNPEAALLCLRHSNKQTSDFPPSFFFLLFPVLRLLGRFGTQTVTPGTNILKKGRDVE